MFSMSLTYLSVENERRRMQGRLQYEQGDRWHLIGYFQMDHVFVGLQ